MRCAVCLPPACLLSVSGVCVCVHARVFLCVTLFMYLYLLLFSFASSFFLFLFIVLCLFAYLPVLLCVYTYAYLTMDCVFVVEHNKAPHVCFPVCLHACVPMVAFACPSAWRCTVYISNGNRTSNSLRVLVAAIHRTAATTVFVTVHACTRAGVHVAQLSAHSTWNYTQSSPRATHPLPDTTLSSPETAANA